MPGWKRSSLLSLGGVRSRLVVRPRGPDTQCGGPLAFVGSQRSCRGIHRAAMSAGRELTCTWIECQLATPFFRER